MHEAVVQPVPAPETFDDFTALVESGVLVDLGGRPLEWLDCRWCSGKITTGTTCPQSLKCPTCLVEPGRNCRRPSGHVLARAIGGGWHRTREDAADALDDQRAADGDLTVPAPWPQASVSPSPAVASEYVQPDLFAEVA